MTDAVETPLHPHTEPESARRPAAASGDAATVAGADLITSLTVASLRDLYQQAGYRVETITEGDVTFLRSATNGLAFDIRPGNSFVGTPDRFADFALVALFAVRGSLPLELLNDWNRTRRFGRLFLDRPTPGRDFLVFCFDISVAGGITPAQLRAQIDIWDSLVQQLLPWLREEMAKIAPSLAGPAESAESAG